MGNLEREKTEIPCPSCGRSIELTYRDLAGSKREAQCRRCKSSYKFNSSDQSRFRSAIRDFERSQEKFGDMMQKVISNADILIDR
tara:strand:+ start:88 stop:342 length:255 start_codon:yes stop_codon:yes gene_type:complete